MPESALSSPDTARFIDAIESAVGHADPQAICRDVKAALEELATRGVEALPERYVAGSETGYARNLLHRCPDQTYSIMVMVWNPGQGTAIHDHAGKWCVECVADGEIEVVTYDPVGDPNADACGFRETDRVIGRVGDVGVLVPPQEYHRIANVGTARAVTIHVYEGEMLWCHTFQPIDGSGQYRRLRRDLDYDN